MNDNTPSAPTATASRRSFGIVALVMLTFFVISLIADVIGAH